MVKNRMLAPLARLLNTLPGGGLAFRINLFPHIAVIGFFLIYLITLSPQIFWRDSAEFVATAYSLSISHTPGSPTYNLLAKISTFLPLGSIAFKVNLFSSICGALVVLLIFKVLRIILEQCPGNKGDTFLTCLGRLIALLSALLFGVSFAFWRWSVCAEVYSLQNFFIILMVYLSLVYAYSNNGKGKDSRVVFLIAYLFALSLGAHMTNALFLPALALFFIALDRRFLLPKRLLQISFFGLLGFSVYLYLPLRYFRAPIKLGSPSNFERFWEHMSAARVMKGPSGTWETVLLSTDRLGHYVWRYLNFLQDELSLVGMFLGIIGLTYLGIKARKLAIFTVLLFLGNLFFFLKIWNVSFGFIPSFMVYSLWIAIGAYSLIDLAASYQGPMQKWWLKKGAVAALIVLALSAQVLINFSKNLKKNNLSGFYTLHTYGKNLLSSLDYKAVIIANRSIPAFPIWYFQIAENGSPDLISIPLIDFPHDNTIEALLTNEWENYNFYWMGCEKTRLFADRLVPNGLIFKFKTLKEKTVISETDFLRHLGYRQALERDLKGDKYVNDYESYAELGRINNEILYYYELRGDEDRPLQEYKELIRINPESSLLNLFYGFILSEKKELKKAAYYFNRSNMMDRHIYRGRLFDWEREDLMLAIGRQLFTNRYYKHAIKAFTYLLEENPSSFPSHYYLALALANDNQLEQALLEFRKALALRPEDKEVKGHIKNIEKLLSVKATPRQGGH